MILQGRFMQRPTRRITASRSARRPWHPRAYVRRAVTLRVDSATADGRVWLGLVRNLSVQGMSSDSALRHVAHEVAPGTRLTVACVLPSGRPCTLRAMVVHGDRHGCGVPLRQGAPPSLAHLAHYYADLDEEEDLSLGTCSGRW